MSSATEAIQHSLGKKIHIVGVGGAGMSAIARVLTYLGCEVTGSDLRKSHVTRRLEALGIECRMGHSAAHIGDCDAVVHSSAVREDNPELIEARRRGLPVFRRADVLAALSRTKKTIAVAGTHGKTTTASMLALAMAEAGMEPAFMVGAELNDVGTNAAWTEGEWLVLEADESDGTFLELDTYVGVVTNVDADHLENWGESFDRLVEGFFSFCRRARRAVVLCDEDPVAFRIARGLAEAPAAHDDSSTPSTCAGGARVVVYGTSPEARARLLSTKVSARGTDAIVELEGSRQVELHVPIPGRHFALNATAVVAAGTVLGIPVEATARAVGAFAGVERRMAPKGTAGGIAVFDDYAHTPAEVAATLAAARAIAAEREGNVVAVFQPHLYSRTRKYASEFADALRAADFAVVTEVYGAREAPIPGVSGRSIVEATNDKDRIAYRQSVVEALQLAAAKARPGDVVVTMGAGDIGSYCEVLFDALEGRPPTEAGASSTGAGSPRSSGIESR